MTTGNLEPIMHLQHEEWLWLSRSGTRQRFAALSRVGGAHAFRRGRGRQRLINSTCI